MSQASKKSSQPTAKLASDNKSKANFANFESGRNSAETVVKMGGKAVKDFMSTSAYDAQKAQDKMFAMTRESSEQLVKSADTVTKVMYETIGLCRDNVETMIECGNMTAALIKDMSTELFEASNQTFSENLELSKEFFACRTFHDMFDLQNRMMKQTMDKYFTQSMKLSSMMFEYANEAIEPINERISEASEQISKALSA